jgi:hypothetical protein
MECVTHAAQGNTSSRERDDLATDQSLNNGVQDFSTSCSQRRWIGDTVPKRLGHVPTVGETIPNVVSHGAKVVEAVPKGSEAVPKVVSNGAKIGNAVHSQTDHPSATSQRGLDPSSEGTPTYSTRDQRRRILRRRT